MHVTYGRETFYLLDLSMCPEQHLLQLPSSEGGVRISFLEAFTMTRKFKTFALAAAAVASLVAMTGCSSGTSTTSSGTSTASAANTGVKPAGNDQPAASVDPYQYLTKVPSFTVSSKTVGDNAALPKPQWSGVFKVPGGQDISPQLTWTGFPAQTKSFVVSMYDPQAPTGSGFWHWVVADIPAGTTSLPEGAGIPDSKALGAGAFQLAGDAGAARYIGAAPPAGSGVHNYYITVTALDVDKSGITPTASPALLGFTIGGHTIARATLILPTPAG